MGLLADFNGVDIHQYSDSIAISCENYIDRVLRTHGWDTPTSDDLAEWENPSLVELNQSERVSPLPTDCISALYAEENIGPLEGPSEHAKLRDKHGFAYRTLLGELLYAYITCRPDIGYAVVTLSKFSTCPSDYHYSSLKKVAKYLRRTKHWCILYKKTVTHDDLPPSGHVPLVPEASLPDFPEMPPGVSLTGFFDAAHANDLSMHRIRWRHRGRARDRRAVETRTGSWRFQLRTGKLNVHRD